MHLQVMSSRSIWSFHGDANSQHHEFTNKFGFSSHLGGGAGTIPVDTYEKYYEKLKNQI